MARMLPSPLKLSSIDLKQALNALNSQAAMRHKSKKALARIRLLRTLFECGSVPEAIVRNPSAANYGVGLSRRAVYALLRRFIESGCQISSLEDRPKAPQSHPATTPPEIAALIVKMRKGGSSIRKIQESLAGGQIQISIGGIHKVLSRELQGNE